MATRRKQERQDLELVNQSERELIEASHRDDLAQLPAARLRARLARARRLRQKYLDLARRQRRVKRGKLEPRGRQQARSPEAMRRKADLFDGAVRRLDAALQEQQAPAKPPRKQARAGRGKPRQERKAREARTRPGADQDPSAGKTAGDAAAVFTPPQRASVAQLPQPRAPMPPAAANKARLARTQQQRVRGHASARNRRNQARRDKR